MDKCENGTCRFHIYSLNCRYLQLNWKYLQLSWRYLQILPIWRYLQLVQHRATKMITSLRKLTYEQRLKECNLTTLEERRKRGDLLETHKIKHGLERIPEVTFFARGDTLRRGHTLKIYKERSKWDPRRNFFSQRVTGMNCLKR